MSAAPCGSRNAKPRATSGDSSCGTAAMTVAGAIARGIFSAVMTSSRSHVAKAQCATARFAIVQPCCCVQQGGSFFDCQIGGKPLTQIARTIDRMDARSMRMRREFYLESEAVYARLVRWCAARSQLPQCCC